MSLLRLQSQDACGWGQLEGPFTNMYGSLLGNHSGWGPQASLFMWSVQQGSFRADQDSVVNVLEGLYSEVTQCHLHCTLYFSELELCY